MSRKNDFWFYSLCVLITVASLNGWNTYMRVAVGLNAVVVLSSILLKVRSFINGK